MIVPNSNEAIRDSLRLEQAEQLRGVDPSALADLGYEGESMPFPESRTFPTTRSKDAAFICGCTVETYPVAAPTEQEVLNQDEATKSMDIRASLRQTMAQLGGVAGTPSRSNPDRGITARYLANRGYYK